jgi:hypothetical protein
VHIVVVVTDQNTRQAFFDDHDGVIPPEV